MNALKKTLDSARSEPLRAVFVLAAIVALASMPVALARVSPQLLPWSSDEPIKAFCLAAAVFAVATTPIAFGILARLDWFRARRGRVMQKPEFWSLVCSMILVMSIPAMFAALVIKSGDFDKDRYEFDPNKSWSVLEQGRGLGSLEEADKAVKTEMARLALERKNLVENVKKLDEALISLRAVANTSPAVSKTLPAVLQGLAGIRRSVGLDGPQQLVDLTAPPVDVKSLAAAVASQLPTTVAAPAPSQIAPTAPSPTPAVALSSGLSKEAAESEIASVPEPQRAIASMLPLADVPPGWSVGKLGTKHLETFNAENLFEKIDGRAESFIQYNVKGMAYTYFHPEGDESNEIQLYIFEMADSLKALGKYGSEKPEEVKVEAIGTEGYTAAGSLLFHSGPYYTQIVSTKDDAKFAAFSLEIAKKVAAKQKSKIGDASSGGKSASPDAIFAQLPNGSGKSSIKYVAKDAFGYAFFSDVFMADYQDGDATWQGFLRPYASPAEAKKIFEAYLDTVKKDGAQIKNLAAEGADQMVVSSNIGLVDVVFLKGNVVGGANGSTEATKVEAFSRAFVKSLPTSLPMIQTGDDEKPAEGGGEQ